MQLSLKAKIDQFRLEDEEGVAERPVELLDFEIEPDQLSVARLLELIVTNVGVDSVEEKEEEGMYLKQRTGLKGGPQGLSSCKSSSFSPTAPC